MTFADICHDEAHKIISSAIDYEVETDTRFPTEDVVNAVYALFYLTFLGDGQIRTGNRPIPTSEQLKAMAKWWAVKMLREANFRTDELPFVEKPQVFQ